MVGLLKKIFVAVIVMALTMTAILYEAYSITRKEYERQAEVANDARESITLDLNMIKIAVQTNDEGMYTENLTKIETEAKRLDDLSMLNNRLSGYKARLNYYAELLESKKELLPEIKELKTKVERIAETIKESFVSSKISRDKVREVNPKLNSLKINTAEFKSEKVKSVAKAVNGILEELAINGTTLSECIDTCYKNRITEITNGLNDKIKGFSDDAKKLNISVEKEFQLDILEDLQ